MKTLWHKSDDKDWHKVKLHEVDASHALAADPDHWSVEDPRSVVEAEVSEIDPNTQSSGDAEGEIL